MSSINRFLAGLTVRMVERVNTMYGRIKLYHLRGQFKSIGSNAVIENPSSIMNPQCISIGDNFIARSGLKMRAYTSYEEAQYTPELIIGNNVHFAADVTINCVARITIGDNAGIGVNSKLMDHAHGLPGYEDLHIPIMKRELSSKGGIIIGNNAMVAAGVVILAGVEIGENAIIGSNSVVTRSIPPNCIAVGAPARVVKTIKIPGENKVHGENESKVHGKPVV